MEVGRFGAWPAVREAWGRLAGARRTFVYMSLTVAAFAWLVDAFLGRLLPPPPLELVTLEGGEVVPLVRDPGPALSIGPSGTVLGGPPADTARPWLERAANAAVKALFAGAFAAYGLRRAVGLEVRYAMLADHVRHLPTFLVYGLAGLALDAVAGAWVGVPAVVVLGVLFVFAQFFVVDRDAGPLEALGQSYNVVSRNLGQTVLLVVAGGAASLLLTVPLVLTSAWGSPALQVVVLLATLPAMLLLQALLTVAQAWAYREAVGVRTAGGGLPLEGASDAQGLSSGA